MASIDEQLSKTQDRREAIAMLEEVAPEFVGMISKFCLGEVYARPVLEEKTKEVVAVVSLISLGCKERLHGHLESSLASGMTKEELSEVIMLSSIYLGFPRAIDAMLVLHSLVIEEG